MSKLEDVIKALQLCQYDPDPEDEDQPCKVMVSCEICPYWNDYGGCRFNDLLSDALAILKARKPRVVKISELTSGEPMLVWLEDIDKDETVAGMIFDYVPGRFGFKLTDIGSMDRIYLLIEEYLTRWRCWTSRPDRDTREATPWNVQK